MFSGQHTYFLSVIICFQVMDYLNILSYVPQVLTVGQAAGRYWSGRCSRNDLLNTVAGAIVRPTVVRAGGHLGLAMSTAYPEYAATLGSVVTGVAFDGAMTLTGEKFGYLKNADDGDFAMAAITTLNDANAGMAVATAYHTHKRSGTSVQPMTTAVATTTEEKLADMTSPLTQDLPLSDTHALSPQIQILQDASAVEIQKLAEIPEKTTQITRINQPFTTALAKTDGWTSYPSVLMSRCSAALSVTAGSKLALKAKGWCKSVRSVPYSKEWRCRSKINTPAMM